jgi:hypothetical protein
MLITIQGHCPGSYWPRMAGRRYGIVPAIPDDHRRVLAVLAFLRA